jgi:RNA polymerase sigma factor (sigma-70 family)
MDCSAASDGELVRRSLEGDTLAFAQLVEKHHGLVFAIALSTAGDVAEAQDVAQEAFVEAWRGLGTLREPTRVGTWIAGIARNIARRWRRRAARRRKRETNAVGSDTATVQTPLDVVTDGETTLLVRSALAEIADAYREALVHYYINGRSVTEVASDLCISEDLAKQRLSRGRRALRIALEKRIEDGLREIRPSKTLTAAVMIAVSAATTRAASAARAVAAGKALFAMKTAKWLVLGLALVLATAVAWYVQTSASQNEQTERSVTTLTATASPSRASSVDARARGAPPSVRKLASRGKRDQLVETIRAAYRERISKSHAATATTSAGTARAIAGSDVESDEADPDKDYVRDAMTALLPMVVDCYKQARIAHPALSGILVVNFTIEGEPGVGGVVTRSAIDPTSEIKDPDFGQCVEQTMFAIEIDPPANGGTVNVTFPFTFRPKPNE